MIPTLVARPFHRDGWVYEEKVDGHRMLAYKDRRAVRLISRNGIDRARRYPNVAAAIARLPVSSLVLDGELAVFELSFARASTGSAIDSPPSSPRSRC